MIKNGDAGAGYPVEVLLQRAQWQPITNPTPRSSRPRTTWPGSSPSTGRWRLILLLATFVWGWYGYHNMPKRKDPDIPVRVASAQCHWPGATAEQVEQLVTRPIEQAVAQNSTLKPPSPRTSAFAPSASPGSRVVYIQLDDNVKDKEKQFSDMNLKLNQLQPAARGRADSVQQQLRRHRGADAHRGQSQWSLRPKSRCGPLPSARPSKARAPSCRKNAPQPRVSVIYAFPLSVAAGPVRSDFENIAQIAAPQRHAQRPALLRGAGICWPRRQHQRRRRHHSRSAASS